MKRRGQIAIFVIIALLIVGSIVALFAIPKKSIVLGSCASDSDCVPDSCCHSSSCIAKEKAPQCSGIMCSQVCEPGTLDCGQESCVCENKQCKVSSGRDGCLTDKDCICGGIDSVTGECFVGNINYYEQNVDKKRTCQDFCTGIAGNLETKCINSRCRLTNKG